MKKLTAVETRSGVKAAIQAWRNAFIELGETDREHDPSKFSVDGLWLISVMRENGTRFYNCLGDTLGSQAIVEINPPVGGSPPGRFQGVVALNDAGHKCILHRGELNAGGSRTNVSQHQQELLDHGVDEIEVVYADPTVRRCFGVAELAGSAASIVGRTKKYADACATIRSLVIDGEEAARVQKEARYFEEIGGHYTVGAKDPKTIEKVHAALSRAAVASLKELGVEVANERVAGLGPDLYSTRAPFVLFELKTGNTASDILKAVGQ